MNASAHSKRFQALDAMRGFVLFIVVIFHAARSLCPS